MINAAQIIMMSGSSGGPPVSPVPSVWRLPDNYNTGTGVYSDVGTLGFHVSQTPGATAPTFLADSGFKGKPAVVFSDSQTLTGTGSLTQSVNKYTIMMAFRSDVTSPPGGAIEATTQDQLSFMANGQINLNSAAAQYGLMNTHASAAMRSLVGGQLVIVVYDGTQSGDAGRLRLWRNLEEETLTYVGPIPATTFAGGTGIFLGTGAAGGTSWAHRQMETVILKGVALNPDDDPAWQAYLAAKFFTKSTSGIVVSSDSNGAGFPNNAGNAWPERASSILGWSLINTSSSGYKLTQGSGSPSLEKRDDWFVTQKYVIALGTNDIVVDNASAATLEGLLDTLIGKLTPARFPICVCNIPACGLITGSNETTRLAYNTMLTTKPGITPIDIATPLGAFNGPNFESDETHLNSTGHTVAANTIAAAIG